MRSQNHMEHKEFDEYYNQIFRLIASDNKLSLKQVKSMALKELKIPAYVKPIYAIGTTVTYRVGNGRYRMGKIRSAMYIEGAWQYRIIGSRFRIFESAIKEVIYINNQEFIKKL